MKLKLAKTMTAAFMCFLPLIAVADANLSAGKQLFQMCAACHGLAGEGNHSLNTPASAGQSKWYIEQQLNNFRAGIRGSHPQDTYGRLMIPMASMLLCRLAVEDLASFIATLPITHPNATISADAITASSAHG
mgnify:CR=1 FL=1